MTPIKTSAEAWLDDDSSAAPSAFLDTPDETSSSMSAEDFLASEDKPTGFLDTIRSKADKAADWYVENIKGTTTEDVLSSPLDAVKQIGADTKDIRKKYAKQYVEALTTDIKPTGNLALDAGQKALKGLQVVGSSLGMAFPYLESGVRQIGRPAGALVGHKGKELEDFTNQYGEIVGAALTLHPALNVTGATSKASKVASTAESIVPEVKAADEFLGKQLAQGQQEALAQVAIGARDPFQQTALQQEAALAAMNPLRSVKEVQDEINIVAKDTAAPGARERLAELQAEKEALVNPQATAKSNILESRSTGQQKLTDEHFETNIAYPVQNALDSGVPASHIKTELEQNLAVSIKDPVYRQEIIERAIPEAYSQAEELGQAISKEVPDIAPETVLSVINVRVPDDGSMLVDGSAAKPIVLGSKKRSILTDSNAVIANIGRQIYARSKQFVGSNSLQELGDFTYVRNLSENMGTWTKGLLGNPNGKDVGILQRTKGSLLSADTTIDNFNASLVKARGMGMSYDDLTELQHTYNAYDDYINIDRIIEESHAEIAKIQEFGGDHSKIKELQDRIADFTKKESFLTREQVDAGLTKFENNTAAQYFRDNRNKLMRTVLDGMVRSGIISETEAAVMKAARPNYTPSYRNVDDFTFSNIEVSNSGSVGSQLKFRQISNKQQLVDPTAATANYINSAARSIEQAEVRAGQFKFLWENLDKSDWPLIARESKEDIAKALKGIEDGTKMRWSAEEITPMDASRVQKVGNLTINYKGGQFQISILDQQLFKELAGGYRGSADPSAAIHWLSAINTVARNFIVLNPEFPLRMFQRESMDSSVLSSVGVKQRIMYPISNVKNLFLKDIDPEEFAKITDGLGFGADRGRNLTKTKLPSLKQMFGREANPEITSVQIPTHDGGWKDLTVKEPDIGSLSRSVAKGEYTEGATTKVVRGLEHFANRFDMAPRITQYKWAKRDFISKGYSPEKAEEAAIYLARNLGYNPKQMGTTDALNRYTSVTMFARAFINTTDRVIQLGKYEPKKLIGGITTIYGVHLAGYEYNRQWKDSDGIPFVDKLDPDIKKDVLPVYGPWSKDVNDYFPIREGWITGRASGAVDKAVTYSINSIGEAMQKHLELEIPKILSHNPATANLSAKDVLAATSDYFLGIAAPTSMLPTAVAIPVAVENNRDNFNRPIVPDNLEENTDLWTQYNDNTSKALVDFSYALHQRTGIDVSPAVSEYLITSVTGAVGKYALDIGDALYGAATGKEVPRLEGQSVPFLKVFSGDTTDIPKEGVQTEFYNVGRYLTDINATYTALLKNGQSDPNSYMDAAKFADENAAELAYYEEFKSLRGTLANEKKRTRSIENADKNTLQSVQTPVTEIFGDPLKRKNINEIKSRDIAVMKEFLKKVQYDPNADAIWYERQTRGGFTKAIEDIADTTKEQPKPIDKAPKSEYNTPENDTLAPALGGKPDMDTVTIYAPMSNETVVEVDNKLAAALTPDNKNFFEKTFPNLTKGTLMLKDKIIEKTLGFEGDVYTNTKGDRGGHTKFGVTLATLRLLHPEATAEDVKSLTKDKAVDIFDRLFWKGGKVDFVPAPLQDIVFDGNINHGVSGMTKVIQRALNDLGTKIPVDGRMGSDTLNALNQIPADKLRPAILARRQSLYNHIIKNDPSQNKFKKGWFNRLAGLAKPIKDTDNA